MLMELSVARADTTSGFTMRVPIATKMEAMMARFCGVPFALMTIRTMCRTALVRAWRRHQRRARAHDVGSGFKGFEPVHKLQLKRPPPCRSDPVTTVLAALTVTMHGSDEAVDV